MINAAAGNINQHKTRSRKSAQQENESKQLL